MSADGRVSWVLEITLHQEKACPHFHKGGALCSDGPSALSLSVLDCRGWQKPLLLRETFGHPLPRGHPDTPPPSGPSSTRLPSPGGFPAVPASRLSWWVEAFPRGLEAPGCSSLCPLGKHGPTSDFPSGHCWNAQPSLCVFSLWVGAWELETLLTSSPHPLFGGPNSKRLEPERRLWCGEGHQLAAQNSCGQGKLLWVGASADSSKPIIMSLPSLQSVVSTVQIDTPCPSSSSTHFYGVPIMDWDCCDPVPWDSPADRASVLCRLQAGLRARAAVPLPALRLCRAGWQL